jgi:hypothetical protein
MRVDSGGDAVSTLPTFEEIRRTAYRELGDVLDGMGSAVRAETIPGHGQIVAFQQAQRLIRQAREALNEAAS